MRQNGRGGHSSRARHPLVSDSTGTLTVLARYTLNREAAEVELEFYGPDLEPLGSLTGQTVDAGANWSDVKTLTGMQFDANGDPVGPIYCVAFATETAEDGELNRDLQPKPALQKGAMVTHWPRAHHAKGSARSVAEAANHAAEEILDTLASYYGYSTKGFAGDSGISLLDGGAKWGN